ncbi:MAG: LysR family transcriptional regulator [Phenylobacterium sp.]|uniref:LysR family transcriptional regulator n=1 Tax=Phenylobacterium sp. TaxID=1871053 RepID=UPI001A4048FE|nr:LysR family transcriptional regulator [Phenylobacterium sp.]MBL8554739.1 LysR family transcriptional regulator [Phenylobacterium sp.]
MSDIDTNKLRRLDGGLLLVFRELLRTGRASRVAESLGLSQPAISHALARLRDLFADPLFVRRPHGFEPTLRALELGPQVDALIALAGQALTPAAKFDPAASRRLFRFAAPEFVTALIGASLINRLRVAAPNVAFAVSPATEDEAVRGLQRGEVDFALGRIGKARSGFDVEALYDDEYCVAARKDHPRLKGAIDEKAWRGIGHIWAWNPAETGQTASHEPDVRMTHFGAVPGWVTALLLVASTDGIATCPRRLAERHADRLGLQVLSMPFIPDRIIVSSMRRSGVVDAGVDWFLAQVKAAAYEA